MASPAPVSEQDKHSPYGNNREIHFHARIGFFRVTIEGKNCPLAGAEMQIWGIFLLCASLPSFIPIPYL